MFRRLTLIFALLFALGIGRLSAQELQLKSFELNVMDAAAKTREVLDLAGNPCALLRVFVAVDDVDFKGNLGIRGEVLHARNSEYVMYIPAGSTSITVNAQGFLPFTYTFNQKIEGHKTYVLYLLVPESGPKKHKVETNYVTLEVTPQNATVLIDNMVHPLTEGALAAELSLGNHTYRVAAPQYHTQTGSFEIVATETTALKIDLKPAFGWLDVEVSPVGATVMIDSEVKGSSPCKIKLESGNYFMQLLSEGYIAYGENISITDGETKPVRTALKANFAQITIQAPYPHSEIWLRGEKVATGRWSGRLNAGTYAVESRTEGYEPCKENISVTAEDSRTFTLQMPTPIYSMLKINTTPFGAEVKLDGKVVGKTPWQSNEVLAGRHTLEISKEGYETHSETLTLVRDAVSSINPTLKKQTSASASTETTTAEATSSGTEKSYQVGDYYDQNGLKGVVFEVDATGKHGKIVHMNEDYVALTWFNYNSSYLQVLGTDKYDGEENHALVAKSNMKSKYSAFTWCERSGKGWYLPAIGELEDLALNSATLNAVNNTLKEKGGEPLTARKYASSSESNKYAFWYLQMAGNKRACEGSKTIKSAYVIRPVAKF